MNKYNTNCTIVLLTSSFPFFLRFSLKRFDFAVLLWVDAHPKKGKHTPKDIQPPKNLLNIGRKQTFLAL